MSTTPTTPDDRATAKPAACGACGRDDSLAIKAMLGPARIKVECSCGVSGPDVPLAGHAGDFAATRAEAIHRWNAMWAPRAGEATAKATAKIIRLLYCLSCVTVGGEHRRVGLAIEERTEDNRFAAWFSPGELDAALAELGLAAGREEARG